MAHFPTAKDEADFTSQLEMDALSFFMKVKMVMQELEVLVNKEAATRQTFDLGESQAG